MHPYLHINSTSQGDGERERYIYMHVTVCVCVCVRAFVYTPIYCIFWYVKMWGVPLPPEICILNSLEASSTQRLRPNA